MGKLRSLEMVRAVAALLVVCFHTPIILGIPLTALPVPSLVRSSYHGVDLFFVLSGFIIAHIHASDIGRPWRLANYAFNRIARIYPAVWMMTLIACLLSTAGWGIVDTNIRPGSWNAFASLFLLPQEGDAILNVTWSLKYELVFYLLFAGLILDRRLGLLLLVMWQFAVLTITLSGSFETYGLMRFYLRSISLEFGVGLGCAWLVAQPLFIASTQKTLTQWGLLVGGVGVFIGGMVLRNHTHPADACCALGAGATILALVLLERSDRLWVPNVMVLLGGASYAIYLVHYSAISLVAYALPHVLAGAVPPVLFGPAVAFGALAGIAFERAFDRPTRRLLRERLKPLLLGDSGTPRLGIFRCSP